MLFALLTHPIFFSYYSPRPTVLMLKVYLKISGVRYFHYEVCAMRNKSLWICEIAYLIQCKPDHGYYLRLVS